MLKYAGLDIDAVYPSNLRDLLSDAATSKIDHSAKLLKNGEYLRYCLDRKEDDNLEKYSLLTNMATSDDTPEASLEQASFPNTEVLDETFLAEELTSASAGENTASTFLFNAGVESSDGFTTKCDSPRVSANAKSFQMPFMLSLGILPESRIISGSNEPL